MPHKDCGAGSIPVNLLAPLFGMLSLLEIARGRRRGAPDARVDQTGEASDPIMGGVALPE
jgi:hypothetical protein